VLVNAAGLETSRGRYLALLDAALLPPRYNSAVAARCPRNCV